MIKQGLVLAAVLWLPGCSLIQTHTLEDNAENVRIYDGYSHVKHCQYIKEVIGSEGHWYNYLFISNRALTQGAMNDLKNRTMKMGGNAAHVHTNMFFTTSVTILAEAYHCEN